MKDIRILGVDDSHFDPHTHGKVPILGVVMRSSLYIDGFLKRDIEIDGTDATERIIDMICGKYRRDIRVLMTQGITFGGFNIINASQIYDETGVAVIVLSRKMQNIKNMEDALLKHFTDSANRIALLKALPIEPLQNDEHKIWIQRIGIDKEPANKLIKKTTIRGAVPEPLRVAHLIASAIYFGESKGRT